MELENFAQLLKKHYQFPCEYTYKFVVPAPARPLAETILAEFFCSCTVKISRSGRYMSISATRSMESVEEIIEIYQKMHIVDGLISL